MNSNHPSVFTHQSMLSFRKQILESELKNRFESFLLKLCTELAGSNKEIIGHIKGLLNTHDGNHLLVSITSLKEGIHSKGELSGSVKNAEFKLNIILYGIGLSKIEAVFNDIFASSFPNSSNSIHESPDQPGL